MMWVHFNHVCFKEVKVSVNIICCLQVEYAFRWLFEAT